MRFTAEHEFPAGPDAVVAILGDPSFHRALALPDLGLPEILEHAVDGPARQLRLRYEYTGQLDPIARKLLAGRKLTWLQTLRLDARSLRGSLDFAAEADPKRLHGSAEIAFESHDTTTRRIIRGELRVQMPVVGGTAERRIVPGLVRRLDVEAEAVRGRLTDPE